MKIIKFMLKSFLTILLIITSWFSKSLITALSEALETLRDLLKAPLWILAAARGLLAWLIRPLAPGLSAWISPKNAHPSPQKGIYKELIKADIVSWLLKNRRLTLLSLPTFSTISADWNPLLVPSRP